MKGRALILIFLFLFLVPVCTADISYKNGTVEQYISEYQGDISIDQNTYTQDDITKDFYFKYKGVAYAGIPEVIKYTNVRVYFNYPTYSFAQLPVNTGGSFILYDGSTYHGQGTYYVKKISQEHNEMILADIYFYFDEFIPVESETVFTMSTHSSALDKYYDEIGGSAVSVASVYSNHHCYVNIRAAAGNSIPAGYVAPSSKAKYKCSGLFINNYSIKKDISQITVDLDRVVSGQIYASSNFVIKNETGTIYYQSGNTAANAIYYNTNDTYRYYVVPEGSGDYFMILDMVGEDEEEEHDGDITFNQTFYTDPEDIQVSWDVDSFDSDAYVYEIQVITSVSGVFSQDSWPADGKWNVSPFISSASGAAAFDFYSDGYDLPIWIQGELWAQDKSSGTWTRLDSTPVERYHGAALDSGKISTDKGSYNVSEIVTVTYTSYAGNIKIRAYQHGSITTYWYNDLPSGTDQIIKISFDEKDRGPWDLRLIENDVFTNYTSIEITSGDIPYVKWYRSVYDQGQIVPYRIGGSGGLMLYSTDVDATLSIFDAANTEIYNFSVGSGNNNMQINFAESAAPGMWRASLLNLGVRYNDTTMVTSTTSFVRFDSSKYYVGDTINIEYYLADSTQQISMWDANQKKVVRFTKKFGLVSGSMQTLPYTLSEYNEYSHDIPGRLASGELTLGFWKIFIEDSNGVFIGDSWDEAYVCEATDDDGSYGIDTSNEMISIFFSPEGAFMLYTVCLTMMGLVLAKHPAGGGAGATVGVGFGTYFNVLPVWMLMLTVILLVVMAGVSIAVYYKGK